MAEVHHSISQKVSQKVEAIETFKMMDQKREEIISQLIKEYKEKKEIDISLLNNWTMQMNSFAVENQLPARKIVSKDMFEKYIASV